MERRVKRLPAAASIRFLPGSWFGSPVLVNQAFHSSLRIGELLSDFSNGENDKAMTWEQCGM